MATSHHNLSALPDHLPNCSGKRVGIVVADWNADITGKLLSGAKEVLQECNVQESSIRIMHVPGTFELAIGAQKLAQSSDIDGVICLGCVIQGETRHFDFIAQAAANGIMEVGLRTGKPVTFGVLTTDNMEQARERAGGRHGNKGFEAGLTLAQLFESFGV